MTKEDPSGEEPGSRFSGPKRRDLFLSEYLANSNEERQDVIFRRVRGILNKITPETFDKLSKDLVNVGLDSPRTLRGLIYLLFDKALKDLKYSSLYAKLCQKLSEKSPNFEKEPGPNTFCKFLISKCEDEFERRRKATEDFERKNELTDEEFEQKVIAKQKMLGNIKFICELGKKRLLQEEILHECIRGLLSRKKERTLQDQAQDLECLCQIMRTIGSLLDVETSKNLMNQYFERIDMYSRKQELPSRIRFMLRDVIDLRNNKWRPRPFQREDNVPQPLSKLREEASFSGVAPSAPIDKLSNTKNLMNINKLSAREISTLLDDEPGFTTTTDFHWGTSPFLPHENEFDIFSVNAYTQPSKTRAVTPIKTTTTLQTSASTVSSNPNSNFQISNSSLAPRFMQATRFDHFAGQNHFDTFVRAPQLASSNRSSNDVDSTSSNLKDNLQNKRSENFDPRYTANRRHDKRPFARDGPVTSQSHLPFARLSPISKLDINELDVTAAISQPSAREEQFRCNTTARVSAPSHRDLDHQQLQQPQYRLPPRHLNFHGDDESHRPQLESSKPLPFARNNDKPIANRNVSAPRDHSIPESLSQPPPPPHVRAQPSRGINQEQQINHLNQRHNPGALVNGGSRSRRFDRGHDYEPRQPKFSGANYRLPGRERPQPQNISRNLQPESELNMNWRSPEASRGTTLPSVDDKTECQHSTKSNPSRQLPPESSDRSSKQGVLDNDSVVVDNRAAMEEVRDPGNLDSDFNRKAFINRMDRHTSVGKSRSPPHNEPFATDVNYRTNPSTHQSTRGAPIESKHFSGRDHPPPRFMNNNNNNNNHSYNNNGTSDFKSIETDTVHARRSRRNHHDDVDFRPGRQNGPNNHQQNSSNANHRDGLHQARTNSVDKHEPKKPDDFQRRQRPFSPIQHSSPFRHDNDHKHQNSRLNETQSGHDRRGYRPPPMGRNLSFEGHNVSDSKRGSNRRTEDLNPANNPSTKKDTIPNPPSVISAHHQVLTRLPIPMSAADFSLRPSHNLVGRPVAESKVADKSDEQNQDKTTMSNQSDIKASEREENSTRQAQEVKEWPENSITKESKEPRKPTIGQTTDANQCISKFTALYAQYLNETPSDTSKVIPKLRDMKLPRELHETCLFHAMKHTICRTEQDREKTSDMFCQLIPSMFESPALLSAFKSLFEQMKALEVETPKAKSLVAGFLSRAVVDDILSIEDVAQVLVGGKHHPLFLLFLQKLEKSAGQAWLNEKFIASKINLMDMLPEVDRTKERLASALKDRCLGFLDPMLTIEPDLWAQMRDKDPSPAAVYRWIKDNIDQTVLNTPTFAHVFISCLLKYIHNAAAERHAGNNINNNEHQKDSESSDSSKSSPTNSASQVTNDLEKELLSRYQQIMHAILKDKQMQLATLYALQLFYHGLNFPKGALLRWFHMLYDMSIVDDDVFFIWKEEINDNIPGKGQALFQVNTWLNWLAEPDSEDEEEA